MRTWKISELVGAVNARNEADCIILDRQHLRRPPLRFYITVAFVILVAVINLYLGMRWYLSDKFAHSSQVANWGLLADVGMASASDVMRLMDTQPSDVQMIPAGLVFFVLLLQVGSLWIRQREIYQRYDTQLETLENGGVFVLYLRGFRRDQDKKEASGVSRLEEEIVRRLSEFTPVIAIDNNRDSGITSGAVRIKCPDHAWRDMVEMLSSVAGCVIIDARDVTPGLMEEIETHLDASAGRCAKTLFVYQDYKKKWEQTSIRLETKAAAEARQLIPAEPPVEMPALYATNDQSLIAYGMAGKTQGVVLMAAIVVFARKATNALRPMDRLGATADFLGHLEATDQ